MGALRSQQATPDRAAPAPSWPVVVLPSVLTADALDSTLLAAFSPTEPLADRFHLDLGAVTFVDPTALMYLAACIYSLHAGGLKLELELPRDKRVRDIMRRYRFGATLHALLDQPAIDLIARASERYLSEPPLHYQPSLYSVEDDSIFDRVRRTLAAQEVIIEPTADRVAAATDRWRQKEIKALLDAHLGSKANLVAPGIVHEALANALVHPNASRVVTAGFFDQRATKRHPAGLLTIAFWDDGDSIVSTLKRALAENRSVRTEQFDLYYDWYAVFAATEHAARKRYTHRLFSGDELGRGASDQDLLIGATFPGVTRNPDTPRPDSEIGKYGVKYDRPGMGLYILTSLVCDSFGGEVLIRSGGMLANIRRAPRSIQKRHRCRYRVGVVANEHMERFFSGNHIVVRLPLAS